MVSFHDLVTQSLGAGLGETQVGFGVGRPTTLRVFSQGAIESSGGALDGAVQGDGFLIVKDGGGATKYTRGGHLQVDKDGHLLTATGERLQGWTESGGTLQTTGPIGDIVVPVGSLKAPTVSTSFTIDVNLDATEAANGTFSTSIEVFDSLGTSHVVTVLFTKTANPNEWSYDMTLPDADVASPPFTAVSGTLTFDSSRRAHLSGIHRCHAAHSRHGPGKWRRRHQPDLEPV